MKLQKGLMIIAIAAGIVPMTGCQPDPGVSYRNFKIETPPPFEGEFNPENAEVGPQAGQMAPEIDGVDLDNVPFKLSDYRGKVVMLDFWGDW